MKTRSLAKVRSLRRIVFSMSLIAMIPMARATESDFLPKASLSQGGKALLPILVSSSAQPEIMQIARELTASLDRITGAAFEVLATREARGIFIGTADDWPGVLPPIGNGESPNLRREDYLLKTTPEGSLWIVGRSPVGVRNGIWDLLNRLGFRQFFPSAHWEIWPEIPDLTLSLNEVQKPAYAFRLLTAGVKSATWAENHAAFEQWKTRNRMNPGFRLETGHSYQEMIRRNPAHFEAHPEDLLSNGKLDASHSTVLALATDFALREFRNHPGKDSISMDPSDGGGWRKDSPLGSPSNQAVTLANHVAREIGREFPGSAVGIYAYNEHSIPPNIPVEPNVIVSVATSFIKGGWTVEALMKGWKAQGAPLGIRDYLSVYSWDFDLPGRSTASSPANLARSIRNYHEAGARYWRSEGSNAWGPHGLGYYIAARLLWNIDEDIHLLLEDFYHRSFGAAAPEMKDFFERYLSGEATPMISTDLVGRMYRTLESAYKKAASPGDSARIGDFIAYTRYMELFLAYQQAEGGARRKAYEDLARFSYRVRELDILNSYAVFRKIPYRDKQLQSVPNWNAPENPLKVSDPVEEKELLAILKQGIANNDIATFEPIGYSTRLVPANLETAEGAPETSLKMRGTNQLYLFAKPGQQSFEFKIRGGLIYQKQGPVRLRLYADQNVMVDQPIAEREIPADQQEHPVRFDTSYLGLHRLEIADGRDLTEITWPRGQLTALPATREQGVKLSGPYTLGFYVPRGTRTVAGYSSGPKGRIKFPDGRTGFRFDSISGAGYFSIDVPDGMDGAWWTLAASGEKILLTVPPYLSRSASELLIPQEVSGPDIP